MLEYYSNEILIFAFFRSKKGRFWAVCTGTTWIKLILFFDKVGKNVAFKFDCVYIFRSSLVMKLIAKHFLMVHIVHNAESY